MNDTYTLELNNPLTEDQWDMINDVDFDNTEHITFYTKHGKEVHFYKNAIPIEWLEKQIESFISKPYKNALRAAIDNWRNENARD